METLAYFLIAGIIIVAVSGLAMHAWNNTAGPSPSASQNVMRWRVSIQFAAILALAVLFAFYYM